MRVVLDTSVVVAAWRSRDGASFVLFERLRDDEFEIAVSVPLVLEYEAVLLRHLVAGLSRDDVEAFVDYLCARGHKQTVFYLWRPLLNDPGDDMVAEVAVAAACDAIVTHNIKDFARAKDLGVAVFTPAEFLVYLQAG
jgi:putative PIN family toxin of toxin-antitoxin system